MDSPPGLRSKSGSNVQSISCQGKILSDLVWCGGQFVTHYVFVLLVNMLATFLELQALRVMFTLKLRLSSKLECNDIIAVCHRQFRVTAENEKNSCSLTNCAY